jgi:serine/threonine protein kinase
MNPTGGTATLTYDDSSAFTPPGAFGPYRVMHQIGVGVFGPVFRTYDPDGDRLVAVKAFHLDITPEHAGTLASALGEIVQGGLSHPTIVTPVGAGLSDGVPYLALEYAAAESLDVAIRHYAPAAPDAALPFVVQLAEALDTAHALGLLHGALHLRDIFVSPELARVNGLGVVSALERIGLRGPMRRPYTAPEQIAGADWGSAVDRYALAAIAYELLTGKRATGIGEQDADHLAGVPGVRDARRVTRLFVAALADQPQARPGSARLFVDELADAVDWTGAGTVRQVLVGSDGDVGDPGRPVSHDGPAFAVEGVSKRLSAGAETTGTEGAALTMARRRRPESASEPTFDWTERTLDRGDPEELRKPKAYQPRPPGAAAKVERSVDTDAKRGAAPDSERIDTVLEDTPAVDDGFDLDDTFHVDGDDDTEQVRPSAAESRPDQLVLDPEAPTVRADRSSLTESGASRPDAEDETERYDGPAPTVNGDDHRDQEDDEVDLSVVQARYRQVELADLGSESESDGPDSQAAGVYEVITLTDLDEQLGETDGLPEENSDEVAVRRGDRTARRGTRNERDELDEAADHPDDRSLVAKSDGGAHDAEDAEDAEDYDPYGDDDDDLQAGVIASGAADHAGHLPTVPVALIAAVITVAAFAVGFRWVAGDPDATDEPTVAEAEVADSGADAVWADLPAEPAAPSSREFSEASVAGATVADPPVDAPPETPRPAAPVSDTAALAVPAPAEFVASALPSEEPASSPPPAPILATEATVASTESDSEPAPPRADGRLLVRSAFPGVLVVVNGEARGTTPLALADLSYGVYDVRLSREGFEARDRRLVISEDDPIVAISGDLSRLTETRTAALGVGSLFVDTRPRGVEVWLDRRLVGDTPMLIPDVSAGTHEVEFRHDGYRDWATTVQVGPSVQARVTASLDHAP